MLDALEVFSISTAFTFRRFFLATEEASIELSQGRSVQIGVAREFLCEINEECLTLSSLYINPFLLTASAGYRKKALLKARNSSSSFVFPHSALLSSRASKDSSPVSRDQAFCGQVPASLRRDTSKFQHRYGEIIQSSSIATAR